MLLCFVLFAFLFDLTAADNKINKVAFISSFVESQNKPTTLIIWQDCFDHNHRIKLVKNSFIFTAFNQQDSLNKSDFRMNPHHCLFVADLTCTPKRIIEKVNSLILSFSLLLF